MKYWNGSCWKEHSEPVKITASYGDSLTFTRAELDAHVPLNLRELMEHDFKAAENDFAAMDRYAAATLGFPLVSMELPGSEGGDTFKSTTLGTFVERCEVDGCVKPKGHATPRTWATPHANGDENDWHRNSAGARVRERPLIERSASVDALMVEPVGSSPNGMLDDERCTSNDIGGNLGGPCQCSRCAPLDLSGRYECEICSATTDADGYRTHGRGCRVVDEDGGGTDRP